MGKKGGVFGGVSQTLFGDGGAGAAQNAALAQQGEAGRAYQQTADIVNPATVQGLLAFDKDIANQSRNLERQEKLISQIDPTLIEASQQALKLLRGEESSTLNPLRNQRAQQRQKLLNSLREQLGPGAETSTAGIQALTKFDSETDNLFSNAQQNAIQGLGNTANQFNATRPDMNREIMSLAGLNQGRTGLQFNQASLLNQARQGVINNAGAQYTKDVMTGKQNQAFGQQMLTAGITAAATMAGGPMAGAAAGSTMNNGFNNSNTTKTASGTYTAYTPSYRDQ